MSAGSIPACSYSFLKKAVSVLDVNRLVLEKRGVNDLSFIDDSSFLDVEPECGGHLVPHQHEIRKDQMTGRAADVDAHGRSLIFFSSIDRSRKAPWLSLKSSSSTRTGAATVAAFLPWNIKPLHLMCQMIYGPRLRRSPSADVGRSKKEVSGFNRKPLRTAMTGG